MFMMWVARFYDHTELEGTDITARYICPHELGCLRFLSVNKDTWH
jgi:hypothetical protein